MHYYNYILIYYYIYNNIMYIYISKSILYIFIFIIYIPHIKRAFAVCGHVVHLLAFAIKSRTTYYTMCK